MLLAGASAFAVSSSARPFLNDLMPLATSPIRSETLPRPPNSKSPTARTISQCQMLKPPMNSSVRNRVRARGKGSFEPETRRRGRQKQAQRQGRTAAGYSRVNGGSGARRGKALLLGAIARRNQAEVEIARFERVFVVAQRRIVGRQRHGKAGRHAAFDQAGAFELVEPGQIGERVEAEMRQERFRGSVGH